MNDVILLVNLKTNVGNVQDINFGSKCDLFNSLFSELKDYGNKIDEMNVKVICEYN